MRHKKVKPTRAPRPKKEAPSILPEDLTTADRVQALQVVALANVMRDVLEEVPWFKKKFKTATYNYMDALNILTAEMAKDKALWGDLNLIFTQYHRANKMLLGTNEEQIFLNELIVKPSEP